MDTPQKVWKSGRRLEVVIRGERGSGKSTLAFELWKLLQKTNLTSVSLIDDRLPSAAAETDDQLREWRDIVIRVEK